MQSSAEPLSAAPATSPNGIEHTLANGRVAVHDPAIVEENGVYYLFGTHRRCARSTDMVHWERFDNNLSRDPYALLGDIWQAWPKQDSNPDLLGNTWAPDVIWNETMGKWCMYLSVNGDQFRSVIVLLTADHVDGDWTYVGPVVYSGFDESNLWNTDVPKVLELEPKTDGTVGYDLTPLPVLAQRHAHQRHRRGARIVRARRNVDEFRFMVRRHLDVQARSGKPACAIIPCDTRWSRIPPILITA